MNPKNNTSKTDVAPVLQVDESDWMGWMDLWVGWSIEHLAVLIIKDRIYVQKARHYFWYNLWIPQCACAVWCLKIHMRGPLTQHPSTAHVCPTPNHPPTVKLTPLWLFPVTANIVFCRKQSRLTRLFLWVDPNAGLAATVKVSPHIEAALVFKSLHQLIPTKRSCLTWRGKWCFVLGRQSMLGKTSLFCNSCFFLAAWLFGLLDRRRKPAGKSFPFSKSMHWISGPSPTCDTTRWNPL